MSSIPSAKPNVGYPIPKTWRRRARLLWWILSILVLASAPVWFNLAGRGLIASDIKFSVAYYLLTFGFLFLLAWLLTTTPSDAIKLPIWLSDAIIATLALLIWLVRWRVGCSHAENSVTAGQVSWYLFCALQIGSVILALVFLRLAKRSPWWACLTLFAPLYDAISNFPSPNLIWTALLLDLLLAGFIFWLKHRNLSGMVCLSLVAGIFPPAVLLFPLLKFGVPPSAYPPPRQPFWLMTVAAILPMAILWFLSGAKFIPGATPWRWTAAIEPTVVIRLGPGAMTIYALVLILVWLWVLRFTLVSAAHPLSAIRACIIFFMLTAVANPLRELPGILLVLGLSCLVWTTSAWTMIFLFLPLIVLDLQHPSTHGFAWRAVVNVPYISIVLVLLVRDIFKLPSDEIAAGGCAPRG